MSKNVVSFDEEFDSFSSFEKKTNVKHMGRFDENRKFKKNYVRSKRKQKMTSR